MKDCLIVDDGEYSIKESSELIPFINSLINEVRNKAELSKVMEKLHKKVIKKIVVDIKKLRSLLTNLNTEDYNQYQLSLFGIANRENGLYIIDLKKFIDVYYINNSPITNDKDFYNKAEFAFNFYDSKNEGFLDGENLYKMLELFNRINCLSFDSQNLKKIAASIVCEMSKSQDSTNKISKNDFLSFLYKFKSKPFTFDVLEKQRANSITSVVELKELMNDNEGWISELFNDVSLYYSHYIWVFLYLAFNIYFSYDMFINSYKIYISIGFAKMFRATILFNSSLLLVFVCKNINSFLSNSFFKYLIPFENFPKYHKTVAFVFLIGSLGHTLAHLIGTFPFIVRMDLETLNKALYTPFQTHPTYIELLFEYPFGWTGVALCIILVLIGVSSLKYVRQNYFEIFYNSHQLFYLVYPLSYIHGTYHLVGGQLFHVMAGGPFCLLILENLIRLYQIMIRHYKIDKAEWLEAGIIKLTIKNQSNTKITPGQYVSVHIPTISLIQSHPFTVSTISCSKKIFTLHVSPVGYWTKMLQKNASKIIDSSVNSLDQSFSICDKSDILENAKINIFGPYGAPTQRYEEFKWMIFIASGIGATPFASIINNMLMTLEAAQEPKFVKLELYWMQRNAKQFTWLINLFKQVIEMKVGHLINFHIFYTCPFQKYDFRAFLLWHGLEQNKSTMKEADKVSEYCKNIYWSRPNFDTIFKKKANAPLDSKCGVFVCGNKELTKEIKLKCKKYSNSAVSFNFFKENF